MRGRGSRPRRYTLFTLQSYSEANESTQSVAQAYTKVLSLFKSSLTSTRPTGPSSENQTAMTQDILLLLLPYLSPSDSGSLFELILQPAILSHSDNGVQKRGYKILAKLVESKGESVLGSGGVEGVLGRLDDLSNLLH